MRYHKHKQQNAKKSKQTEKKIDSILGEKEKVTAYTLSTDACGIAKLGDGSIVFVDYLLPGENATVKIVSKKSTYKRASVLHRQDDSSSRAAPPCSYYSVCGGCQLQHIKQDNQIEFKIQWFFETLKRVGKWDENKIKLVSKNLSVIFMQTNHYRRRVRLHYDGKNLGFYENESHRIVDINECYIARPKINEKISELRKKINHFYTEIAQSFSLTEIELHFEITEGDDDKIIMHLMALDSKQQTTSQQFHQIKSQFEKYFEIQPDQLIHLRHPQLGKFKIKKESFIQPHFYAIESYYEHLSNCVDKFLSSFIHSYHKHNTSLENVSICAWDLYAGCGIFSCIPYFSSEKVKLQSKTIAIEGVSEAVHSLNLNYKQLPIEGLVQDVAEFIDTQFENRNEIQKANVIILDPPRSGVGIQSMQKIVELCAPESCILYLACDPASFARDTQILIQGGFYPQQVHLFDFFGQTYFYEVLGCFTKGV